jgi:hypothetical protein
LECASAGNQLFFTATATDVCDLNVSVNCVPSSGSPFPLGTTFVHCTARDASGNSNHCSFTVTLVDTTPPQIVCPTDLTVEFSTDAGAAVNFSPTVTDLCSEVALVCAPPSGTTFPIGATTVTCTATASERNKARGCRQTERSPWAFGPSLFLDQTHLQIKRGDRVFHELKQAAHKLRELMDDEQSLIPSAQLQGFIDRMVGAARLLAVISLQEVIATGGNPKKIAEDTKQLGKGDDDVATGGFESAFNHYRNVWKHHLRHAHGGCGWDDRVRGSGRRSISNTLLPGHDALRGGSRRMCLSRS